MRRIRHTPRATLKSVCIAIVRPVRIGLGQRDFFLPMAETRSSAFDQTVPDYLISFLKATPKA